jgi:release factor glutamine methyltransferase
LKNNRGQQTETNSVTESPTIMTNKPQTVTDLLRSATSRLAEARSASPRLDAEVLLRHSLGIDRSQLFARLQDSVNPAIGASFSRLVDECAKGTPVAYLTGAREFMGLSFIVRPGVLIPRPETEQLVEWALEWLRGRPNAAVVDSGTGSGAIVLSLAKLAGERWTGQAIGIDISPVALTVARDNRAQLELDGRVELIEGDLLEQVCSPVDLIVANLPYLTPVQIAENPALEQEPGVALDGGEDGLDLIRRLIDDAPRVLSSNGAIALELDPSHAQEVASMAGQRVSYAQVRVFRDLAGRERFVIVERNNMRQSEHVDDDSGER